MLDRVEQLDLAGCARDVTDQPLPPGAISLDAETEPADRVRLRLLTPTELKSGGGMAERPEFQI